jgi:hypothetical protein
VAREAGRRRPPGDGRGRARPARGSGGRPPRIRPRSKRGRAQRTLKGADGRAHEQHEADERGDGVAGQAEDQRLLADAESDRLAGLDRHTPEDLPDAELGLDATDEIVGADGDSARGDDEILLERLLEGAPVRGFVVADCRQQFDDRAAASSWADKISPFAS